uniref:Uncharacterized protein n=1 Tax=Cyprinus carpio TaxID=7962 RepID=A0A8C1XZI0_CYPCA
MTKAFLPQMEARNHGHIAFLVCSALLDYCVSKFGAVGCHESLTHSLLNRSLIPLLDPLYCVQESMKAILANVRKTQTHALNVLCCLFFRLLPWEANVATYRFMGGDKCLYSFLRPNNRLLNVT